jgi:hypothetical protein
MRQRRLACLCCLCLMPFWASGAFAQQTNPAASTPSTSTASEQVFSSAELDQMLAPIALYPDPLLAQVLMASTYPGDVAEAATWSKAHPDAKGDAAVKEVANQPWDPSVQSLVAVPQVLASLSQDPNWVIRLGDAFLAEPDRVMASVQRLRNQAQQAGNLKSNEYQKVTDQPATDAATPQTIVIEPASPTTVYVPNYNPNYVYGSWAWGGYPPYYYPPPAYYYPGAVVGAGIAFGVGLVIADSLWGNCNWGRGDININAARYNNINVNRQISGNGDTWRHNSANRDGTPYRDRASRENYGKQLDGARDRANSGIRGDDAQRAHARDNARQSMDRSGIGQPARTNLEAQDRARQMGSQRGGNPPGMNTAGRDGAGRAPGSAGGGQYRQSGQGNAAARDNARLTSSQPGGGGNNAFSGARNPGGSQAASQRGRSSSASRGSSNRGAGRSMSRPARGGGGGRRR